MTKIILTFAIIIALVAGAWAAGNCDGAGTCYVAKSATGTGTGADWTNACTDFTGNCDVTSINMRGTTIFVASVPGNPIGPPYTATTFSAPDSGTTPITIIVASSANHGTQTGWRKEYATAVMIMQAPVNITTDYWVFNGQNRAYNWRSYHDYKEDINFPSMCNTGGFYNTGYHFNIVNTNGAGNAVNVSGSNVTIEYAEIHGTRTISTATDAGVSYGAGVSNDYLGFSEVCYTGGNSVNMSSASNMTFEYNHFDNNRQGSSSAASPSAINVGDVNGLTVRYNEFRDITGSILTDGNTDATAFTPNWYFYGNVVWWNPASVAADTAHGGLTGIVNLTGETLNSGVIQVYNNTFAELNVLACTTGLTCNAIALNLNGASGGSCAAHTQNCIGATAPVGTAFNNFWWDGFAGKNVSNASNAQWTATGDYGEGACLTSGCTNSGTFTVVGANDVNVTEANPFVSFYRPAITKCDEMPNLTQEVQDIFNGCFFDFRLTIDTAAGTSPSGWTSAPSGCTTGAGGNCENIDRTGVVRGTLGTGSQVSRGAFQFLARRLSGFKAVAVQATGHGVTIGGTAQEVPVCTWTSAPTMDACPDSSPPFVKTWTALNPDVATISSTGLVTGVTNGNAFFSLNYGAFTDFNIVAVVTTGTGAEPNPALPTGIVRTGSPMSFASYNTTQFDANFPTTYNDPCPVNGVGGCTRWGTAGSPIPVITTAAQFTQALNGSQPGDTIVLQAGTTYSTNGVFAMPARANPQNKWTYIISSNESSLPPQGTRINPISDEPNMAILAQTGGSSTLSASPGADHWWISGIEATCTNTQVTAGSPRPQCGPRFDGIEDVTQALPDWFVIDRCYMHGDDSHDTNHGVIANVGHFAILDSYIDFFGHYQQQADALSGYITNGPIKVINNTIINGWGQDSIFGGAGGYSNPYHVQDAYFARNTVMANQTYRVVGITIPPNAKYEYANNFEFKDCLRCLIDGNIVENSWASAQGGAQFVMNAGTGVNGANVIVDDITYSNNILIGGLQPLGNGGQFAAQFNGCDPQSQPCYYPGENRRIALLNNLVVQGPQGAPGGRARTGNAAIMSTIDRFTTDYLFQHNTLVGPYLTDYTYCENSLKFQPVTGDTPATSNVWLLDNVLCRQLTSGTTGDTGTTLLNDMMIDPSSVPITTRYYGNIMEYFPNPPTNDKQATWPANNQAINQQGTSPVTYNNPKTGDYTMTSPMQIGSDGVQSGIQYSTIVAHQAPPLGTCNIAGTVTGAISSGVALVLTGTSTTTAYSFTDGTYNFPNLKAGTYTVTPFGIPPYPGTNTYTFSPVNATITLTSGSCSSTANNFNSTTSTTFSISGQVTLNGTGLAGVSIALTGTSSGTTTTNSSGNYSFTGLGPGTYTLKPTLSGYSFTPPSLNETISTSNITNANFTATATSFSISGTVSGAIAAGVTMTLSGAGSGTTTTNSSGNYAFNNLINGNYTVTPSLSGYSFTPPNRSVTISGANVTAVNFTSAQNTFSISGTVSGAIAGGVTMTLSGAGSGTTTTAANGTYSFTSLVNGTYTITPTASGFSFSPTSQTVTVNNANVIGIDFTSSNLPPPTHLISGTVSGVIQQGVLMSLTGTLVTTTTTASNGTYSFTNLADGPYVVTPSLAGYIFRPISTAVTLAGANVTGINFLSIKAPIWHFPAVCEPGVCP